MNPERFHPKFPEFFPVHRRPVWGGPDNKLISLGLIASIPTYTLYKEGSRKRKQLEKLYWEEREKDYNALKKIYDQNVYIGTVFTGDNKANNYNTYEVSCKITKIYIDSEKAYVCYKASDQHVSDVEKENKKRIRRKETPLKPIKPGKFGLIDFLNAIENKTIFIIKVPPKKNK
jgi:hypothetical protein